MIEKNLSGAKQLLDLLERQENDLVFDFFSFEDALKLGIILTEVTNNSNVPLSMRVFLDDCITFQYTMGGKYLQTFDWTQRKYNLIKATGHSSMHGKVRKIYFNELLDLFNDKDTYGFGCGGFPIVVKGKGIVGAVAISGLPDPLDHFLIIEALERFLNVKTVKIPSEVDETWF